MGAALHRPAARQRFACKPREGANDTPRKQIDHDCQIQETPVRADISDIGDPKLVGGIHVELPVQSIVRHDSRTATIRARLLFITNLGPYARQSGQAPSPIGTDVFAEIAQIVMQLAVSLDLATLLPSCLDKHGLPLILQRPLGKGVAQPCIEATRMNHQHPAHGPDCKDQPVLGNEGIPHRDSLAKYVVVGSTGQRNIFSVRMF